MTNQKNTPSKPTQQQLNKLLDIFNDYNRKGDKIDMLIQKNLPETKKTINTIHALIAEYTTLFNGFRTFQEARNIIEHQEFEERIHACAINIVTKQELAKQLIQIMKISVEKHRKYVTESIISMMIDLWDSANQKKMIVTMITNEIKKYTNENKHRQATFLSKELNLAFERIRDNNDKKYMSWLQQKISKITHTANIAKESRKKQQWFTHAEKLFAQGQYKKAEKIFRKLIQPEHSMRSDISATQLIYNLNKLLTADEKSSFSRKLRSDGKTIQIPYRYLQRYFEKVLSMDRAVLSTEFMIYHEQERIVQTKPYNIEKFGFWSFCEAIKHFHITKILDDKKWHIDLVLRNAYTWNNNLDYLTIKKTYTYLEQIDNIEKNI